VNFGVIGYGYWGPNVVRNLASLEGSHVCGIAEMSPAARHRAQKAYPGIHVTADASELIASPDIDAIAVITPVWTHYELAKAALENGKHVFVEKPFTSSAEQGEKLIELARKKNLRIMVDHTFLFTGAVRKICKLLEEGTLGKLFYYDSTRVNLGLFQHDINVLWDLAPHDLSIMDYLIQRRPEAVVATGQKHLNVYDKGVNITSREGVYELLVSYRSGDMWAPQLEQVEALREELTYFVDCVSSGQDPHNDGCAGLRVVKMLEAATDSLKQRGSLVYL
jgi:predicted dehydrogenase